MNPVVKAQLEDFRQTNPITGYSESDYFEVYATFSIANGLLRESLSPFDMHLKGHEFGIDAVGILIQGDCCADQDSVAAALQTGRQLDVEFLFVQAKSSEKFEYGEISKFLDAVYGFFTGGMHGESEQLDDLIAGKDEVYRRALRKNPKLRCYFATTGTYESADRIEKLREANRLRIEELNLFEEVEIELIGAKELQSAYRGATNANSAVFEFPKCQTMPIYDSVEQAYIGYISAAELLKLVIAENDGAEEVNRSVFFDNIRDYVHDSDINKQIVGELRAGDPGAFVFKNNGVTVVANSITRTGDRFSIDNFQIVNGCQTCNILFQCRDKISGVFVPLRLIGTSDEQFISGIIIGTNRQNEVKEEQFWALRPFMKDLEEYCRQQTERGVIYLERRENQYRREAVERNRITKPSDVLKCVAAMFLLQPHRAARDYRGIRREYENQIFQSDHSVEPYYLACLASWWFDFLVRNGRVEKRWQMYKYYFLYVVGFRTTKGKKWFDLGKSDAAKACGDLQGFLSDEGGIVRTIQSVCLAIEEVLRELSITSRADVRDQLRLAEFSARFDAKFGLRKRNRTNPK